MTLHWRSLMLGIALTALVAGATAFFLWPPPKALPHTAPPIPQPAPTIAAGPAPQPDLILDLFEPTPDALDTQQKQARLQSQIEHALVVTFLLTRCNYLDAEEYSDTYNVLIRYAERSGLAPDINSAAAVIHRIAGSASASYSLVYSRVPCDSASLPPLAASLIAWRDQSSRTVNDSSSTP